MRGRNPLLVTRTPDDFAELLKETEEKAREIRDLLIRLMASPPSDEQAWIALMSDPGTAKGLGALLILNSKTNQWIQQMVKTIGDNLGAVLPPATMEAFLTHFYDGETEAEMSCTCSDCPPCVLRADVGDERARAEIAQNLRPKNLRRGGGMLVDSSGRPLH